MSRRPKFQKDLMRTAICLEDPISEGSDANCNMSRRPKFQKDPAGNFQKSYLSTKIQSSGHSRKPRNKAFMRIKQAQ
jgi:hypothetical protein